MLDLSSDTADTRAAGWQELVTVILLSITAVVTAWAGFQASKWGGAMSIAFSQASSTRIESSKLRTDADAERATHVALFTEWAELKHTGNADVAQIFADHFPEPLATAFLVWEAKKAAENKAIADDTPFDMEEYKLPAMEKAKEAEARADEKAEEALENNQQSDNYTVLTVAFAVVLFFGAVAGRMNSVRGQWFLLSLGILGFFVATAFAIAFPKLL